MTSSALEAAAVVGVSVTPEAVTMDLADGRSVAAPLGWYPRLAHATPTERGEWRLVGGGSGVHWPAIDEDISAENLLAGKASGESPRSLGRWLAGRATGSGGALAAEPAAAVGRAGTTASPGA